MEKMSLVQFVKTFFPDFKLTHLQERILGYDLGADSDKTVIVSGYRNRDKLHITNVRQYEPDERRTEADRVTRRLLRKARTSTPAIYFKATSTRRGQHLHKLRGLIQKGQIIINEI